MLKKKFIKLFKREYEEYKNLQETARKKQNTIIENDIEKLSSILSDEQNLLNDIEQLEKDRIDLLQKIADENNIDTNDEQISFNELVDLFSDGEKKELRNIKDNLVSVLSELEEINEENRQLIEDSLMINAQNFEMIRNAVKKDNTYSKPGKKSEDGDHYIDRKV